MPFVSFITSFLYGSSFFSSLGGPMLVIAADFLNFLTLQMIFTGSASPITVTVFFDGSRTIEVIPSIVAINFITFFLHFEQSSSTDTTVFCTEKIKSVSSVLSLTHNRENLSRSRYGEKVVQSVSVSRE